MSIQRNKVTQHIADIAIKTLQEFDIEDAAAKSIGLAVADELTSHFGGQVFAMPAQCNPSCSISPDDSQSIQLNGMAARRSALLKFLAKAVVDYVKKMADEKQDAETIANAIVNNFCAHFSGENLVIPKDHKFKIYQRDQKILNEFNGLNLADISTRYSISVNALYRILKKY